MPVSGDVLEITINHPTYGSFVLYPKAGEDSTFDLGGFSSNDDAQMIDGGGNMIDQLTQKRWGWEGTVSWDMNTKEDLEKLQALSADPEQADFTFTHINKTIYGGKGKPVGDIQGGGNAGTIAIKFAGGGRLKKI